MQAYPMGDSSLSALCPGPSAAGTVHRRTAAPDICSRRRSTMAGRAQQNYDSVGPGDRPLCSGGGGGPGVIRRSSMSIRSSPNHHALAERFGLFNRFFVKR